MSRGPGKWQRIILAIAESIGYERVVLAADVVPMVAGRQATKTEMVAIRRAIKRLAEDKKISVGTFRAESASGASTALVGFAPLGTNVRTNYRSAEFPAWHDLSTDTPNPRT